MKQIQALIITVATLVMFFIIFFFDPNGISIKCKRVLNKCIYENRQSFFKKGQKFDLDLSEIIGVSLRTSEDAYISQRSRVKPLLMTFSNEFPLSTKEVQTVKAKKVKTHIEKFLDDNRLEAMEVRIYNNGRLKIV
jgi:hypothetical protein